MSFAQTTVITQTTKEILDEKYRASTLLPFGIERNSPSVYNDVADIDKALRALNDSCSVIASLLALIKALLYVGDR